MTYINRNIDKIIKDWFNSDKRSLMILGARQIGKSESIKEFLRVTYGIEDDSILPMLDIENTPGVKEQIINGNSDGGSSFIRNLFINAGVFADLDKCKIIFIDEIQALSSSKKNIAEQEIKTILLRLLDEDEFKFIFSGSLLGAKISNLEEFTRDLPGGIIQERMYPISFCEFVECIEGNNILLEDAKQSILSSKTISIDTHVSLLKRFAEYSFVGGMPAAVTKYVEGKTFSVSDALDAISSLSDSYIMDTQKYYLEEFDISIGNQIFEWLLFGMKENDKTHLMKKFKDNPEKTLYEYIVDSDTGLLVKHEEEYNSAISEQNKPKTYFNDVGFMRLLLKQRLSKYKNYDDVPKQLRSYYDKRDLDKIKLEFFDFVDNNGGCKLTGAGAIYEQVVAQTLKSNAYNYACRYQKNPEREIEFIIHEKGDAIEVKSGDFEDYISSQEYASLGNKVFFLTMLPYVGEAKENFILLPVYSLCLINYSELDSIAFESVENRAKEIIESGKLPSTKGFY